MGDDLAFVNLGTDKTAKQVAASRAGSHTCAILNNDKVKCWGSNSDGQIGDGTSGTNRLTPTDVSLGSSTVKQICLGRKHTCAIMNDDNVKCWGKGNAGQLGNDATTDKTTPTAVINLSLIHI